MKTLTAILLLITISASSQTAWKTEWIKQDKALHVSVSTALAMLGTETAKDWNVKNPELIGVAFSLTAGMTKEFVMDKQAPSAFDLGADIVGAVAGVYVNRWINKQIQKKWKYKQTPTLSNLS